MHWSSKIYIFALACLFLTHFAQAGKTGTAAVTTNGWEKIDPRDILAKKIQRLGRAHVARQRIQDAKAECDRQEAARLAFEKNLAEHRAQEEARAKSAVLAALEEARRNGDMERARQKREQAEASEIRCRERQERLAATATSQTSGLIRAIISPRFLRGAFLTATVALLVSHAAKTRP